MDVWFTLIVGLGRILMAQFLIVLPSIIFVAPITVLGPRTLSRLRIPRMFCEVLVGRPKMHARRIVQSTTYSVVKISASLATVLAVVANVIVFENESVIEHCMM